MIDAQNPLSSADINAWKQNHGYSGSVLDGNNPRLAWQMLPLFAAVHFGHVRIEKNVEF